MEEQISIVRRLAAYKVPKTIEIVDAIPRTEPTKVNRGLQMDARWRVTRFAAGKTSHSDI